MTKSLPQTSFRLVHWNIWELDSSKLQDPDHPQLQAATAVLENLQPDILSINEIHFDLERAKSIGRDNLQDFTARFPRGKTLLQQTFAPANSGSRAGKTEAGEYLRQPPERGDPQQALIDRSNFGLFPGQYATGLATALPITRRQIFQNVLWRDWQPGVRLEDFQLGRAAPEQLELFDKSFSVSWLDCLGSSVAIVCLHAVPAFNFGEAKSPNALRNAAQVSFLEWFLLGETLLEPSVQKKMSLLGIEALDPNQRFIAVGDFNCPLHDGRYPAGKILQRLLDHPRIQPRQARIAAEQLQGQSDLKPEHTYFSKGWDPAQLPTQLDYILVSKGLEIIELQTVFVAANRQIHALMDAEADAGAELEKLRKPGRALALKPTRVFARPDQAAVISVADGFAQLRSASDHLPLILDFKVCEL